MLHRSKIEQPISEPALNHIRPEVTMTTVTQEYFFLFLSLYHFAYFNLKN